MAATARLAVIMETGQSERAQIMAVKEGANGYFLSAARLRPNPPVGAR